MIWKMFGEMDDISWLYIVVLGWAGLRLKLALDLGGPHKDFCQPWALGSLLLSSTWNSLHLSVSRCSFKAPVRLRWHSGPWSTSPIKFMKCAVCRWPANRETGCYVMLSQSPLLKQLMLNKQKDSCDSPCTCRLLSRRTTGRYSEAWVFRAERSSLRCNIKTIFIEIYIYLMGIDVNWAMYNLYKRSALCRVYKGIQRQMICFVHAVPAIAI